MKCSRGMAIYCGIDMTDLCWAQDKVIHQISSPSSSAKRNSAQLGIANPGFHQKNNAKTARAWQRTDRR